MSKLQAVRVFSAVWARCRGGAEPPGRTYPGSLYLAAAVFLPLGLPQSHAFWSAPAADWTQKRLWNGEDLPAGHSLADR